MTYFNVMAVTIPASPKHPPMAFKVSGESTICRKVNLIANNLPRFVVYLIVDL